MAITYDAANNRILGDGFSEVTPMDYDDFVTADRAGSYEILAAVAPALNLTLDNVIRPLESLALFITFTLAGTNAGAGDTLDVTGTDAWGGALSENIDVSGGNAAYTTTERFATITDIDCTGFADGVGTVSATQPQWGVVWEDRGHQGRFDCPVYFGTISDGYCAFERMQIVCNYDGITDRSAFSVPAGSQLRFGKAKDETDKITENHSQLAFIGSPPSYVVPLSGSGTWYLYGLSIFKGGPAGQLSCKGSDNRFWNCLICDGNYFRSSNGDFFNVTQCDNYYNFRSPGNSIQLEKVTVLGGSRVVAFGGNTNNVTFDKLYARGTNELLTIEYPWSDPCNYFFLDADVDTWAMSEQGYLDRFKYVHRQYRCDLHVVDEDGNDWTSKTVEMKDNDDDETFSVSTDGSGEIAQQKVDYIVYGLGVAPPVNNEYPHVINLKDGATLVHTLTGLIIDGPMKRRIEIPASYPAEADVENGVNYGSGLTGDLVVPAEAEVLDGVGFGGGSGSEHAGTVVQPVVGDVQEFVTFGPGSGLTGVLGLPAESEVKTNVGFGANDTEFLGALIVPQSPLAIDLEIDGPLEIAVALSDLDVAVDLDGPLEIAVEISDLDVAVEISDLDVAVEVA